MKLGRVVVPDPVFSTGPEMVRGYAIKCSPLADYVEGGATGSCLNEDADVEFPTWL